MQFANKLGFRTVAIARGSDKAALARKLGAHHFIDNATEDVAAALIHQGGARAVLATVSSAKAIALRGRRIVIGVAPKPTEVTPLQLIGASRSIVGHAAGRRVDRLAGHPRLQRALLGVRPMIETLPLARQRPMRMMRDDARFRMVLTIT